MKKFVPFAFIAISIWGCHKNEQKPTAYKISETESKIEWKGPAPDHFHVGSLKVNGSLIATSDGKITGGDFVIPISSIEDYDLPDPVRKTLLDDLLSPNFFSVLLHPEATFHITNIVPYSTSDTNAVAGANYIVTGNFSMVGQTHPISFPFKVSMAANSLIAEAKFNLDRTKWGMNIYSDPSQALYILPDVNIHLNMKATMNK